MDAPASVAFPAIVAWVIRLGPEAAARRRVARQSELFGWGFRGPL